MIPTGKKLNQIFLKKVSWKKNNNREGYPSQLFIFTK